MHIQLRLSHHRLLRRATRVLSGLVLGWCATLPLSGCDDDEGSACVENESQACACADGMGAQTCQADGTWGVCSCGPGTAGGGESGGGGGGADAGGGDDGGGADEGGGSSSEHSCCLNDSFFECPDADASATCFGSFDPSGCSADPSRNAECGGGGGETGGAETGGDDGGSTCSDPGQVCATHGDCCDGDVVCVEGTCAAPCAFDDECASLCCAPLEGGGGACAPAQYC